MSSCLLIKTDRVLYDEMIFAFDEEEIIINNIVPLASNIIKRESGIKVTLKECSPVYDNGSIVGVEGLFHIDMVVAIRRGDSLANLTLAYSFDKEFFSPLSKIEDAFIEAEDMARAVCRIVELVSDDQMLLTPGETPLLFHRLSVNMKLKLVVPNEQIFVNVCPSFEAKLNFISPPPT